MAYTLSVEEFELLRLARLLGGAKKVKELLKILEKHNTNVDDLINYLKSVDYKVPSQLELRVEELEKRISALES
jgi:GTP-dependent phosphoenolpyruvate carboxykinase